MPTSIRSEWTTYMEVLGEDRNNLWNGPAGTVIRVTTSSPSASATHRYEEVPGITDEEVTSASEEVGNDPVWRKYIQTRLSDLYRRIGWKDYPTLETLNGAWAVVHGVLGPTTRTPSVLPGEERSVEFIWNRRGWHIALEISDSDSYVWAKNLETGDVVAGDLDDTREVLQDLLATVSGA